MNEKESNKRKKIRVLIVDDEEQFAYNLSLILKYRNFEVATAFDGFQALNVLKSGKNFDVIILDDKMPKMNGVDAIKKIKTVDPDTEIILMTGHAGLDTGIRAIHEGAFDYMMKPCDMEELVEKIKKACEVGRIKHESIPKPKQMVGDIFFPIYEKLETSDPLSRAVEVFNRYRERMVVEEVYIQDRNGRLKGVVNRQDLLDVFEKISPCPNVDFKWSHIAQNPHWLPDERLKTIMRPPPPLTAKLEDSLIDIAHQMVSKKLRCMPVVRKGELIGFIRLKDILKSIHSE